MSRSRRRAPVIKDSPVHNTGKRFANKVVRRTCGIPSGGAYRLVYESWRIHDWRWWVDMELWYPDVRDRLRAQSK